MRSSTLRHGSSSPSRRLAALWLGVLAGPLGWLALLETNYLLSYVACEQRQTWMLHLSAATALTVVATGALLARGAVPADGHDDGEAAAGDDPARVRARFMATGGLLLCAWFALVILATEIPVWVLGPCTP